MHLLQVAVQNRRLAKAREGKIPLEGASFRVVVAQVADGRGVVFVFVEIGRRLAASLLFDLLANLVTGLKHAGLLLMIDYLGLDPALKAQLFITNCERSGDRILLAPVDDSTVV